VGSGRRKLCDEEFVDTCVKKDDGFTEGQIEGSVTDMGVERN
jgi:hypothetical protein